ncbi:MAG: TldD protein [Fusobacteria bacterium]|nr:MAG: TldD protein [Fusobacteriota bacterium]KAF0230007.1 MAG: TldD [Fusobacteriota bacterium]
MIEKILLEKTLEKLTSKGCEFADIYLESKSTLGVVLDNKKIERITRGSRVGAGLRVIYDGRTYFAFTEDLSEKALFKIAGDLANKESGENILVKNKYELLEGTDDYLYNTNKEKGSLKEKADLLIHLNELAWRDKGSLIQLTLTYGDVDQEVYIMNSNGVYVHDKRPRVKSIIQGVFQKEKQIQSAYDVVGAVGDYGFIKTRNMESLLEGVKLKGENLLTAKEAPSGTMPVIVSGQAGGTMVHEACGHGLEADIVKKGMSVYGEKIGEKVASELISVVDDGTIKGRYGTSYYDDEGTKTKENILIENGILKGYMSDLQSAIELGIEATGNGRREGYHAMPITRMTNTYISKGKDSEEDIIASIDNGLFVKHMGGGQVNTATGDFVFEVSEGYLIKNGKIGEQVRGATLIGNGPDVLNKIDMVANDFGYSLGTCGKDGQGAPVADGQPTLRIPSLVVGGTN